MGCYSYCAPGQAKPALAPLTPEQEAVYLLGGVEAARPLVRRASTGT
jgi:hypothetical protein